ncbi:hypothetical protein DMA11_11940 [Marinilabiliaceae bacterium JC017]|nr:hypothetical protein DMA11_11940 [Marinilabiliaceae bacterium JC017]
MKKINLLLGILMLSASLFAQKMENVVWNKKYGFEEGMTQALMYKPNSEIDERRGGFLSTGGESILIINSQKGTLHVYPMNIETGEMGELKFEKNLQRKGTYGATILTNQEKTYLLISYADYGEAEMYAINNDGSIGEKTWSTETWERGINLTAFVEPNRLMLCKPDAGWAWGFEVNFENGTIDNCLWATQDWVKGITGMTGNFSNFLLVKPDGQFWDFDFRDNAPVMKYYTNSYDKNITTIACGTSQDLVFIGDPGAGKQWILSTQNHKEIQVKWATGDWEKGLTVQAAIENWPNRFLFVAKPNTGSAWVFKIE